MVSKYKIYVQDNAWRLRPYIQDLICGVLASSVVDHGIRPRLSQTKDYKICICCFSAKHAEIRSKITDLLARNQDDVSAWSGMSTRKLLFQ